MKKYISIFITLIFAVLIFAEFETIGLSSAKRRSITNYTMFFTGIDNTDSLHAVSRDSLFAYLTDSIQLIDSLTLADSISVLEYRSIVRLDSYNIEIRVDINDSIQAVENRTIIRSDSLSEALRDTILSKNDSIGSYYQLVIADSTGAILDSVRVLRVDAKANTASQIHDSLGQRIVVIPNSIKIYKKAYFGGARDYIALVGGRIKIETDTVQITGLTQLDTTLIFENEARISNIRTDTLKLIEDNIYLNADSTYLGISSETQKIELDTAKVNSIIQLLSGASITNPDSVVITDDDGIKLDGDTRVTGNTTIDGTLDIYQDIQTDASIYNTFLGVFAGQNSDPQHGGTYNTFFGYAAGMGNTNGSSNVFFGRLAGFYNTKNTNNSYVGTEAGRGKPYGTGKNNSFFGMSAGYNIDDGSQNTLLGKSSGYYLTNGSHNVALGSDIFFDSATADDQLIIGSNERLILKGDISDSTLTATGDLYVQGDAEIDGVTTLSNSLFVDGGKIITNSGSNTNTVLGVTAGESIASGTSNVMIGYDAGGDLSSAKGNVIVGSYAGRNCNGFSNTFVGDQAGKETTDGYYNVYLGYQSGYLGTSANTNTFLGYKSGRANTTGSGNVYLGYKSGETASATASDSLIIANSETNNLITGNFETGIVEVDSLMISGGMADKYSRDSLYTFDAADTWYDIKFPQVYDTINEGFFTPNADSTGFVSTRLGVAHVDAILHYLWTGAGGTQASAYQRVVKGRLGSTRVETKCGKNEFLRSNAVGDFETLNSNSQFSVAIGDTIFIQSRVSDVDMVLRYAPEGVFDSNTTANIIMEYKGK